MDWPETVKTPRGDQQVARAFACAIERRVLEKDVTGILGKAHPFLAAPLTKTTRDRRCLFTLVTLIVGLRDKGKPTHLNHQMRGAQA